jgi:hypothetical protein
MAKRRQKHIFAIDPIYRRCGQSEFETGCFTVICEMMVIIQFITAIEFVVLTF